MLEESYFLISKLSQSSRNHDSLDWLKDRQADQWDGTESPETKPYIYGQLILDKGAKTIQ